MNAEGTARKPPTVDYLSKRTLIDEKWLILKKLGQGGYGQVYKAFDLKRRRNVAMKVETKSKTEPNNIMLEVRIIKELSAKSQHCAQLYEYGDWRNYSYFVMQLLGLSLSVLRKACPMQRFSTSTTSRVSHQCIEAIKDLHSIGFLHRDIKVANFMIGLEGIRQMRRIYLIDFGMAKKYLNNDGTHYTSTEPGHFRGTLKYASIAAHDQQHLSRRDDLWSMFYAIVEMLKGSLPWSTMTTQASVRQCKMENKPETLCEDLHQAVRDMATHVEKLNFTDAPDYGYLMKLFENMLQDENANWDDEYDWEKPKDSMPVSTPRSVTPNTST